MKYVSTLREAELIRDYCYLRQVISHHLLSLCGLENSDGRPPTPHLCYLITRSPRAKTLGGILAILDSYSVQSENLFLTYSCRQKVDDFLNGVIRFAIRGLEFTVYGECWVWLSVKQAVGQRATDTLVEKDKHHGDF